MTVTDDAVAVARLNFNLTDAMHMELLETFARHRLTARRKALEDAADRLTKQGYTMSPESIRAMIEGEG